MSVFKNNQVSVPGDLLQDKNLSEAELGLLCRILSFQEQEDEFVIDEILNICHGDQAFVQETMKALEKKGYLVVIVKNVNGVEKKEYEFYLQPKTRG